MVVPERRVAGEINIGLIGCGAIVESAHLPALASIPGVEVRWVCDASPERADRVSRTWGVGQIFSKVEDCTDVDAVLVATPVGTRRGILEKTTARGWHAFCEKPFATSTSEHWEMLKAAELNGVKLGAGYMRRFFWAAQQARKMVSKKVLGPLIEVIASDSGHLERTGIDLTSYRNNATAAGGGVLTETGCHLLDEVMFVSGAKSAHVEECAQKMWNEYEIETVASGYISLDSGEKVSLQLIVSGARPVFQGIALRFESGEIRLRLDAAKGLEVFLGHANQHPLEIPHPRPNEQRLLTPYRSEWLHFFDAIRTNSDWDLQLETGLITTDVITQCGEIAKLSSSAVTQ
jgi:predicted dehydrogenase